MPASLRAEGEWEITPQSQHAADLGLQWLAHNQGPNGNWRSNNLGLVGMGVLAFLSAGYTDHGRYGSVVRRGLDFILANAKPSGLLNITEGQHDMYNHGLATFVLTQAYGMVDDRRIGPVLDKALKLICDVQCDDGGWDYRAVRLRQGHDCSLAVMQAKALRGAMDEGFDIPPHTVEMAIAAVRRYYWISGPPDGKGAQYGSDPLAQSPGRFTYQGNQGNSTTAMAAAGVVCLQEFGQYGDFRILRSLDAVIADIHRECKPKRGVLPLDPYTMYYVAQGLYQVGGQRWRQNYPFLRDAIVKSQNTNPNPADLGSWESGKWVTGPDSRLWGTAVGVFTLSIPNRYLPLLQQVPPETLRAPTP